LDEILPRQLMSLDPLVFTYLATFVVYGERSVTERQGGAICVDGGVNKWSNRTRLRHFVLVLGLISRPLVVTSSGISIM
jgi:hypothetical protein